MVFETLCFKLVADTLQTLCFANNVSNTWFSNLLCIGYFFRNIVLETVFFKLKHVAYKICRIKSVAYKTSKLDF